MTAIFAFARGDVAFVAADTMRNYPGWGRVTAIKVHEWSDRVVIAQAGDGKFQSELISEMKLARPMLACQSPSAADDQRLITAFNTLWPAAHQKAVASVSNLRSGVAHISGTMIVASAADVHGPARIHLIDFATGQVTQSSSQLETGGQDPSLFMSNASALMQKMHSAGKPFNIDEWGICCVESAIAAYPNSIGWPVDIILARGVASGERLTIMRRAQQTSVRAIAEFQI